MQTHLAGSRHVCIFQPSCTRFSRRKLVKAAAEKQHLSICVNKTCKKQGSQQVAKFVEDLHLADLTVKRTGCLAKCGAGPNIVLSPLNVHLSHVKTVSKMTAILREVGGLEISDKLIKATTLRLQGNTLASGGQFRDAIEAYNAALDLDIAEGRHLILANRAGVLLGLGKAAEALEDAQEASRICPADFHNATFRQVEAHIALKDLKTAREVLETARNRTPSLDRNEHYQQLDAEIPRS